MDDFKAGAANYEDIMQKFIDIYGVQMEIPGFYLYDSKISPLNSQQIL